MDKREIMAMVFQPGFSTAAKVTNVSGRGVGMDVVKTNIERIGGAVSVDSTLGEGTVWRLTIPLTLAIIQALTVDCGDQRYVVPQVAVLELVFIDGQSTKIEYASGAPVYRLRGKLLPLVRLDRDPRPGRQRRPGRLHHGAAGRRPPLRPRRRPRPQHRGGRRQGAQQPVQGHRPVRRRHHPRRRQGRPDPGHLRRWPAARTSPVGVRAREPGRHVAGHQRAPAPASGCWSPRSANAGWRSRWTRSPGSKSSRGTASSRPGRARSSSTAGRSCRWSGCRTCWGVQREGGGRHRVGGRLQRGRAQRGAGRGPDRRHRRELRPPPAATRRRTAWSARRSSSNG